jgi:hypothetical protein
LLGKNYGLLEAGHLRKKGSIHRGKWLLEVGVVLEVYEVKHEGLRH